MVTIKALKAAREEIVKKFKSNKGNLQLAQPIITEGKT